MNDREPVQSFIRNISKTIYLLFIQILRQS